MTTRVRPIFVLNEVYLYLSVSIVFAHAFLVGYTRYKVSGEVLGLLLPRWRDVFSFFDGAAMWVSMFIGWFVVVGVAHTIAIIGNGQGQFRDLLALWGLGAIPQLLTGIMTFYILNNHVTEIVSQLADGPLSTHNIHVPTILQQMGLWNAVTQYVALAWGGYCVYRIHKVTWLTAVLAVVVPFALPLLFRSLWNG